MGRESQDRQTRFALGPSRPLDAEDARPPQPPVDVRLRLCLAQSADPLPDHARPNRESATCHAESATVDSKRWSETDVQGAKRERASLLSTPRAAPIAGQSTPSSRRRRTRLAKSSSTSEAV